MKQVVTVSNALVCAILDGSGIDTAAKQALLAHAGLAERAVRDITARTSIARLARLWRRLLAITGDGHIGLRIGSTLRAERFGLSAHAAQHVDTFRGGLQQFAKYATLVNDLLECRLEETPPTARFTARLHWNVLGLERHAVDITFAAVARFARDRIAAPFELHAVRLKHALTASEPAYRAVFAAPVELGANRNELVFDAAALDAPMHAADRELGQLLDRYAALELSRTPVVADLPARVAQIVREHLEAGRSLELTAIAAALATSQRSLQRKLRDHATSFSAVVDDVRRALAPEWLVDPDGNVEQVGFRLGYSEPTAFIRAFKKWYGMTPGAYRRDKTAP